MWCGRPGLLYQFRNSTTGHNVDLSRAWVGRLQHRNFSMLLLFLLFEFTRCFHHSLFGQRNEKKDCGTTDRRYSKTWATKEVVDSTSLSRVGVSAYSIWAGGTAYRNKAIWRRYVHAGCNVPKKVKSFWSRFCGAHVCCKSQQVGG